MPAVQLISSLPAFATEDVVESTPRSFSDMPVLLKHQEKNVQVTLDPPLEAYPSAVQGTLYILTSVLVFMPDSGSSGFQIEYPAITLHAISRDESGPSIYCQLDDTPGDSSGLASDSNEDDEAEAQMRELILVPHPRDSVETIFEALSQCASLHPDPEEGEDEEAFLDPSTFETFNGSEEQELSEVGRTNLLSIVSQQAALEHMDSIIYDPHQLLLTEETGETLEEGSPDDVPEETTNEEVDDAEVEKS